MIQGAAFEVKRKYRLQSLDILRTPTPQVSQATCAINCVTRGVSPDWRPSRPMTRQRKLPVG